MDENLILIDSVSKRFSACGARIGALISRNKALMEAATKIAQARLSVATLDQIGAAALYTVEPSCSVAQVAASQEPVCAFHTDQLPSGLQ